jgi:hypothetical protein
VIAITFTHKDDNGKVETFANDSRDIFVWETTDKQGRGFLAPFTKGEAPRVVDLYRLAWITAKRLELIDKSTAFDAYANGYTIEIDMEEAEVADPTQQAASPDG